MKNLVYGVGINDIPRNDQKDQKIKSFRILWQAMLERCFDDNLKNKYPAYLNVSCCDDWLVFSKFLRDVLLIENSEKRITLGWHFDKDILIKGNSDYSNDKCCFIPREINNLFTKRNADRGCLPIGVSKKRDSVKFVSQVRVGDSVKYLGLYSCELEAFNAYKIEKERYIKYVAEKWKGIVSDNVYNAMINYKVDIND